MGAQTYASMTDEERLKVFSGPRPLTIRFVRRNQRTKQSLDRESRAAAEALEKKIQDTTQGVDVTDPSLTADALRKSADFADGAKAPPSGGLCFCSASTVDK